MAGDDQVAELEALLERQARQIEDLEARLAAVEGMAARTPSPAVDQRSATTAAAAAAGRTDRRDLLRQAGVAVAGVATGAVVLGQASPAAAAQGTFDGNPAVLGTANPNTGLGVRGETLTGTGVQGRSQAAVGPAIGVEGLVAGTLSTGVKGIATNAASATTGVLGQVASPDGVAVKGVSTATSGSPVGVRGEAEAAGGVAVVGNNAAASGDAIAIAGINSSPTGTAVFGNALAVTGGAIGVAGTSSSNSGVGVRGTAAASGGTGVSGTGGSKGVFGTSPTNGAIGVEGIAMGGVGVSGTGGTGVVAISGSGIGLGSFSNRAQAQFLGAAPPPFTNALARFNGEVVFDTNKVLWLCIADGTPGTWRRLGGAGTAGALTLLNTPVRVYDSRPGNNPTTPPKTPITGNTTRVIDTKNNSSGVPAGATGVLVTLTVVNGSANGGFLALFKAGAPTPSTSSINWSGAGQVVATTTVSAVDATAQVAVFCPPNSSTDLILDVIGFYQ